jgi:hypothetical protein
MYHHCTNTHYTESAEVIWCHFPTSSASILELRRPVIKPMTEHKLQCWLSFSQHAFHPAALRGVLGVSAWALLQRARMLHFTKNGLHTFLTCFHSPSHHTLDLFDTGKWSLLTDGWALVGRLPS